MTFNINYIFLITITILLIISIILFYTNLNIFQNKAEYEYFNNNEELNKIVCFYTYYEKNDLYKNNFKFFLEKGILPNVDYYIIINGDCSIDIPEKYNIVVYKRENKGYDFGAYSYAISRLHRKYNYYFFINTSVCGPYLHDYNKPWTDYFIELFNNDSVKLVGTSINIYESSFLGIYNLNQVYDKDGPFTHIQSMMFCMKNDYFEYLNSINFFNEEELNNISNIDYIIAHKEIGLSQYSIKNGWNINCILDNYKNLDYRDINYDINPSSITGDPYYPNAYWNKTIDKYDIIFFKSYRLNE
jgi:hypothetical protein